MYLNYQEIHWFDVKKISKITESYWRVCLETVVTERM